MTLVYDVGGSEFFHFSVAGLPGQVKKLVWRLLGSGLPLAGSKGSTIFANYEEFLVSDSLWGRLHHDHRRLE